MAEVKAGPKPLWAAGPIRVRMNDGSTPKAMAKLRGPVGVHQSTAEPFHWQVTAAASGLTACRNLKDEANALRVGAVLAGQGALGLKTKAAVLRQLPKWVGVWCLACARAGVYLDPDPYRGSGEK